MIMCLRYFFLPFFKKYSNSKNEKVNFLARNKLVHNNFVNNKFCMKPPGYVNIVDEFESIYVKPVVFKDIDISE